ncbi:MAG: dihydrofolate reductase [Pseudobdellovibrionaceae bacterium]
MAMSKNRVIGNAGTLPWHIPEDLKFFRDKTKNHIMIMGRKTFESLPKVLPSRFHIIVSRNLTKTDHPDVMYVTSIDAALQAAKNLLAASKNTWGNEVFVIGGGDIFRQTLSQIDKIYLTQIDKDIDGDTFYPTIDERQFFLVEEKTGTPVPSENRKEDRQYLNFSFLTYLKRK